MWGHSEATSLLVGFYNCNYLAQMFPCFSTSCIFCSALFSPSIVVLIFLYVGMIEYEQLFG